MIIVAENTMLHISRILVTRTRSRIPSRSAQLVWAVMDADVDAVVDTKAISRSESRAMIISMGIEMIMVMFFKRVATLECTISVVKSVDGILPTLLDFILLGSVILELLSCHLTMTIVSCQ